MIFDSIRLVSRPDNVSPTSPNDVTLRKQNVDPNAKYILKNVDGLGPPEIDTVMAQSLYEGDKYQNSRPQGRQVVINILLQPDYEHGETVSDLRTKLYAQLYPPMRRPAQIELLYNDEVVATTRGYVKIFDINPFSKDPEVQITYSCMSAFLQGPKVDLNLFDIDFYNPTIYNPGNAPTGFHMEVWFTGNLPTWGMHSTDFPGYNMEVDGDFKTTNYLIIDTRPGFREVTLVDITTNEHTNLVDRLVKGTDWMMLDREYNSFTTSHLELWTDFSFYPQYWGV